MLEGKKERKVLVLPKTKNRGEETNNIFLKSIEENQGGEVSVQRTKSVQLLCRKNFKQNQLRKINTIVAGIVAGITKQ